MSALLEVVGLRAGYGPIAGAPRTSTSPSTRGRWWSLLGANGAGKTTTMRALCQMIDTHGSVRFDGEELVGKRTEQVVRRGIAHVPQGRGTFTELTVEENLEVGAYIRSDRAGIDEDIDRWFTDVPPPAGATHAAGRQPVRRRAADAGRRPRAHDPASPAAPRRAVASGWRRSSSRTCSPSSPS